MRPPVLIFALLVFFNVKAQISIHNNTYSYNQNFNSLSDTGTSNDWTNNSTLAGWYATSEKAGDYTKYRAGSGTSSTTGLYSFGTNGSDRSIGSLNQNASLDIAYGILFENNSGGTINSATISFTVEQWRRVQTNSKGYHVTKLSYQIANSIDVTSSGIINGNFIDINEGYLISLDTTSVAANSALDGNDPVNSADISIEMPLHIADGEEFFLRFYDENVPDIDHAIAVDDLTIDFSDSNVSDIATTSDYEIAAFLETSIIANIPSEDDGIDYLKVTEGAYTDLESLFSDFYSGNYSAARSVAATYDYVISSFTNSTATYYTLRKQSNSAYYWGTYVTNSSPLKSCVAIQAPHPVKDTNTGTQAASVFNSLGASNFIVSGISRCTSDEYVKCIGTTEICGSDDPFRISDPAHNDSTAFHLASSALNNAISNTSFIQLHGFEQKNGDPEFIFSNGSSNPPSIDNLGTLQSEFQANFPALEVDVVHIDGASKLKAFTNVFGRSLNNYPGDICTDSNDPTTPNGRFLHLEQYYDFRDDVSLYDDLAIMISNSIDCGVMLPVELIDFYVGINENGTINIIWEVAWEDNVTSYEIQRSDDAIHYYTIGNVKSKNMKSNYTYEFQDYSPPHGICYYRIKQLDIDGKFEIFQPEKIINKLNVSLYPNPTNCFLYINGLSEKIKVKISNLSGQVFVKTIEHFESTPYIDLESFPSGILIVEINRRKYKILKQ